MAWIVDQYNYIFYELADVRTVHLPLMSSPFIPLGIVAAYLMAVYIILPAYMMDRKPYNLKTVIATYNIFQVAACFILIYGIGTSGWTTHYTIGCQMPDPPHEKLGIRMVTFVWWTLMLKMVELIETAFFILRKKYNQVSVLHVYHHASTFLVTWLGTKYYPGGMLTLSALINCGIHVMMYSYYFLTAFGPDMQKRLEPLKPKLTAAQMIQMMILFVHISQILSPSCKYPNLVAYIYLPNLAINLYFFMKFYITNYVKPKKIKV